MTSCFWYSKVHFELLVREMPSLRVLSVCSLSLRQFNIIVSWKMAVEAEAHQRCGAGTAFSDEWQNEA